MILFEKIDFDCEWICAFENKLILDRFKELLNLFNFSEIIWAGIVFSLIVLGFELWIRFGYLNWFRLTKYFEHP